MKKLLWILAIFFVFPAIGCGPELVTEMKKAGSTANNDYYAVMAAVNNERGPAATAVTIVAEQRHPGWQQTVINPGTSAQAPSAPPQLAKSDPPKHSPRGKKALICPPPPTPPPAKPVPAQPTVITTTTSPQLQVVGGAGGTGKSTLQSWGDALLSGVGNAAGMIGGAALLRPARNSVNQSGGGATASGGSGFGGAGGAGGSASSSSSSASSASAAAAAAAGGGDSGGHCLH